MDTDGECKCLLSSPSSSSYSSSSGCREGETGGEGNTPSPKGDFDLLLRPNPTSLLACSLLFLSRSLSALSLSLFSASCARSGDIPPLVPRKRIGELARDSEVRKMDGGTALALAVGACRVSCCCACCCAGGGAGAGGGEGVLSDTPPVDGGTLFNDVTL